MTNVSISSECSTQLINSWQKVRNSESQRIHIQAPIGTGSKHVLNHFQQEVANESFTWHVRFRDNLYGWEILPTLTAGLWKTLRHSKGVSQLIQEALRTQSLEPRMQAILDAMADSLEQAIESNGEKLQLPSDNPLLGLVLLARTLMTQFPILFIFENMEQCHSYQPYVFLDAVLEESEKTRSMIIIQTQPLTERSVRWHPEILLHLLRSREFESYGLEPWKLESVQQFLEARDVDVDPELMLSWTDGRQECVAEMIAWLGLDPKGGEAFDSQSIRFGDSANPEKTEELMRVGALLGWSFPIEILHKMLGLTKEQVLELLEEQTHLLEISDGKIFFRYVLHQLRLFEDTIRNFPEIAGQVADNIYSYFGRTRPEFLSQAAMIYGRLERDAEAHEATQMLLDLDDSVLWLAMMEIMIRWNLDYPPYIMSLMWKKASEYQFKHNSGQASSFQRRALDWAKENDDYQTAIDVLRQGGRYLSKQDQYTVAESQFHQALQIAVVQEDLLLQADIRIELVEFYIAGTETRRAVEQLLVLEQLDLSEVQRIRLLGIHALISRSEGDMDKSLRLFLEARRLAKNISHWGLATDLGLLAVETLIDSEQEEAADKYLNVIKDEVEEHDRLEKFQILEKRILAWKKSEH